MISKEILFSSNDFLVNSSRSRPYVPRRVADASREGSGSRSRPGHPPLSREFLPVINATGSGRGAVAASILAGLLALSGCGGEIPAPTSLSTCLDKGGQFAC